MKKLTKKQRHNIYKKALELFYSCKANDYHKKICHLLAVITDNKIHTVCSNMGLFDEAHLFINCPYKFLFTNEINGRGMTTLTKNNIIREQILMFCIEMTRP